MRLKGGGRGRGVQEAARGLRGYGQSNMRDKAGFEKINMPVKITKTCKDSTTCGRRGVRAFQEVREANKIIAVSKDCCYYR